MKERRAIIDIGYNAIRAVVYETDEPGAPEIFNNKFKSDILSLLTNDSLDVKHPSYLSIQYLLHIFDKLEVTSIHCVATAVLRQHPRGEELIHYIKQKYGFDIHILTGQEEAEFTAIGLIHGINDCNGMAADLGGGSLELIEINNSKIGKLASLDLGTKIITSKKLNTSDEILSTIKKEYGCCTYKNLYLIGGAMRFIGRMYLDFIEYPLKNLHNLEIDSEKFLQYLSKVRSNLNNSKNKIGRRKININAILVAQAMVHLFSPEKIIISTYGLKEGVRFKLMDLTKPNILESKLVYACQYDINKTDFSAYLKVLDKIVQSTKTNIYELLKFSIILNNLKKKLDHTLPPSSIVEYILSAELPIKQDARIMLALIASVQSDFKPSHNLVKVSKLIITKENYLTCQIIGHFLCIAETVDGMNFTKPSFSIDVYKDYYEINTKNILPRPIFEKIRTRLKNISYIKKNLG
ncbi:MAG TPA: Ppx/GppA family phosphatase [Candidatus Megaira endosymbiont of Nemacystus decipiens]|nr:Ppx/GppA family phosphatase [Candidatus Megaera endosymbiont of Nemacystus decipiens]